MSAVAIIIPTYNNYEYLEPCLRSILSNKVSANLFHIYVVNNGHEHSCDWIKHDDVTVWNTGKNLGWEGALEYALDKTQEKFVLFLNDDILIPPTSKYWLNKLLQPFIDPEVGAVGPSSNVVMGLQNIFTITKLNIFTTKFLIGFCFLTSRDAIIKAGGIDKTLPGGDDMDMSIRLRKAGYKLIANKEVFVYHHGFKTGNRVYGDVQVRNGWNSYEMLEKTNHALIKKHGFAEWWNTTKGAWEMPSINFVESKDTEGELIRERINKGVILDLGCGPNKTVPDAIGVDLIPKDVEIASLSNAKSEADVNADVSQPLPFEPNSIDTIIARHIMEHLTDSVVVMKHWHSLLKKGGKLIVAVPNDSVHLSIPMNIEHVHGFTMESMKSLMEVVGFKVIEQLDSQNTISFITVGEKL